MGAIGFRCSDVVEEREFEVGLFKSMKDIAEVTKSAKQMQEQQQKEAGYKHFRLIVQKSYPVKPPK